LRLVFAGTPPFAARALEALIQAGHEVALVLTQPDRPAGRGLKLASSAVAQCAAGHSIPIFQPATLKQDEVATHLARIAPDLMVVAAYGLLLPPQILAIPRRGCINIHASLLPRWRGAAPIQRAILAGDAQTGISIMQMDAGLDTGAVLLARQMAIDPRATSGSLTEALAELGARAIVEALGGIDGLRPQPQDPSLATHAAKISRDESRIRWSAPSDEIDRLVRALDPAPGAQTLLGEELLKIWAVQPVEGRGEPGTVLSCVGELVVACGQGALRIDRLQRAGGKRLAADEFLRGFPAASSLRFEPA
jgi:methionyl-tRNA formyltransferase